jgi:hypothetical protein
VLTWSLFPGKKYQCAKNHLLNECFPIVFFGDSPLVSKGCCRAQPGCPFESYLRRPGQVCKGFLDWFPPQLLRFLNHQISCS